MSAKTRRELDNLERLLRPRDYRRELGLREEIPKIYGVSVRADGDRVAMGLIYYHGGESEFSLEPGVATKLRDRINYLVECPSDKALIVELRNRVEELESEIKELKRKSVSDEN